MQEKLLDIKFSSKKFYKKLASFDEDSFSTGNLTGAAKSKEVYKEILQQYSKSKKEIINEIVGSNIKGYIQYYSIQPFIVELWTEVDVRYFNQHAKDAVSMLLTTGSIASKANGKMLLFYTFLLVNTIKKQEYLPLLTNSYNEKPIKWCLDAFLKDEKERYGHNVNTIPLICTCDMS